MAILVKETNNYVKLDLDNTYITRRGVFVATQVYPTLEARELEKSRLQEFNKFCVNVQNKKEELISEIQDKIGEDITEEDLKPFEKEVNIINELGEDLRYIQNNLYLLNEKPSTKNLKQKTLLVKLGFKEEWLNNPLIAGSHSLINTGNFTNQRFTSDSMYKELKKAYKNLDIKDV